MYPNFHRSELAISAAPWAFAAGMMRYLEAYPHGCTEQITSQVFPAVLLQGRTELLKELARGRTPEQGPQPDARKSFDRYLAQLRPRQKADGGFSIYPGGASDPYATVYALHLLVEAKDHKLAVPQDLLQRANAYTQAWLGRSEGGIDGWRQRTQAVYLLTRQAIVAPAAMASLRETLQTPSQDAWSRDIGAAYLAASYQLLKQDVAAHEMLKPVWAAFTDNATARKKQPQRWGYYYDPIVHDSMLVHLVAKHFPAELKTLRTDAWNDIAAMVQEGWYGSLSSAAMVMAVDAYFDAVAANAEGKLDATVTDAQGKAAALLLGAPNPITRVAVPLEAAKLRLSNNSDFKLYYSWSEQGFERNLPLEALNKGLEVLHEVLDANGQPVGKVALGQEVTVRVRVRSIDKESVRDVALVDLLPGGLEPVLQAADEAADTSNSDMPAWQRRLGGDGSWKVQYADIREDRVVFYGQVDRNMLEITYKARATNVGDFVMPAAYAEAMYDRRVFARSAGGRFQVTP